VSAFSPQLHAALAAAGLDAAEVMAVVERTLAEDLAAGCDVTTEATVPAGTMFAATVVARASGTVAGTPVARAVLEVVGDGSFTVDDVSADGAVVHPGDVVLAVHGPARQLLRAERTMLNLLSHLSGVATTTRAWVDAVADTGVAIRDTRKTTPGLRLLDKYAVRCGGGSNHRLGLGDAMLIKDNHVAAAGGIASAIRQAREAAPALALEVECDTLEQVDEAIAAGACLILLDNMTLPQLREAVSRAAAAPGQVLLEASGGLILEQARACAETGVDFLAVGALTHSAPALDLGLDVVGVMTPGVSSRAVSMGSCRRRGDPR